jgi:anti-anti-sigma regulatory factor
MLDQGHPARRTGTVAHWLRRLLSQPGSRAGCCPRSAGAAPVICPGGSAPHGESSRLAGRSSQDDRGQLAGRGQSRQRHPGSRRTDGRPRAGGTTVILDQTLTTFFDSTGLSKIADARQLASAYRIDLRVVVPPSTPLAGFFASSGFDRVLAMYPTLRAALTAPRALREDTRTALCPAARSKGRSTTRTGTGSPRDWALSSRPRTRSHQRTAITVPRSCTATAQPKASRYAGTSLRPARSRIRRPGARPGWPR